MTAVFQPRRIIAVLADHHVECVLIGGLAAVLYGSSATTNDADICPSRDPSNLARLAEAMRSLRATIRADGGEAFPFDCSAEFFGRMQMVNLATDAGNIDVAFEPAGTAGYGELRARAIEFDIDGHEVFVASLDDVIHSKATADRPKDRAALPVLLALRDEIEGAAGRDDP